MLNKKCHDSDAQPGDESSDAENGLHRLTAKTDWFNAVLSV